jgi:hypothetical protein
MKTHLGPSNVEKSLEDSCRKLEEIVSIERNTNEKNKSLIESLEKKMTGMKKELEKAEVNEKLKTIAKELEGSKGMVNSEILKNEKKQQKIEELEEALKGCDVESNNENEVKKELDETKSALERAKVTRITKEKEAEVGQIKVEKIKLEEDLRNTTIEKKRLTDTERILLNTFDTLKKYYDTKDKEENTSLRTSVDEPEVEAEIKFKCKKCQYETKSEVSLRMHISNEHDIDIRQHGNGVNREKGRTNEENKTEGRERRQHQEGRKGFCVYWNRGFGNFG